MGVNLNRVIFDWMFKDEVMTHVEYDPNTGKIDFQNFTEEKLMMAFGYRTEVSVKDYYDFLEYRCVPRDRANIKEILKGLGINDYNPYSIVKRTHGVIVSDYFWIRFEGETLSFNEVRLSLGLDEIK